MNVIISNERQDELVDLNIEIIKNMHGIFPADDIVSTFNNFYFNKMILDVTAIKDYLNISNIQKIAMNLDVSKIIFLLPNIPEVSSKVYLSKLVSMGIYNFTNNIDGVKYLIEHTNTREDVNYVKDMEELEAESLANNYNGTTRVIGIKKVTDHAGATTLTYMMKKELERTYGETVYAIEVNRHDLEYFNVKHTISTSPGSITETIKKIKDASIILIDLNELDSCPDCTDMVYLLEPSSIMLNRLMRINRSVFRELMDKKLVLIKSMLDEKDLKQFEYEANTTVIYNMPPIDDRRKNDHIQNLLLKLGLIGHEELRSNKLFGIFKI